MLQFAHNLQMAKLGVQKSHYLKEWRKFRRLSQEALAEAIGTTGSVISLLENEARELSPKWLWKIAPVLHTSPGFIIEHDPNDLPTDILEIWATIDPKAKEQVLQILKTFQKTGTDA